MTERELEKQNTNAEDHSGEYGADTIEKLGMGKPGPETLIVDEDGNMYLELTMTDHDFPGSAAADEEAAEGSAAGEAASPGSAPGNAPSGRTSKPRKRRRRRPNFLAIAIILVLAVMLTASIRNIVSLQIEHNRLVREHEELIRKRDKLKIELKHVNSREYIEEQARRQLRLVNPDEILFVFRDDGGKAPAEDAAVEGADESDETAGDGAQDGD